MDKNSVISPKLIILVHKKSFSEVSMNFTKRDSNYTFNLYSVKTTDTSTYKNGFNGKFHENFSEIFLF